MITDPQKNLFKNIMSANLEEVKCDFIHRLKKIGYVFDEDVFVEVGIRCAHALKDKLMTKPECIKYFWVAYINTIKSLLKIKSIRFQQLQNFPTEPKYDENIDILCDIICKSVLERYGEEEYYIWRERVYEGKTYKELQEKYSDINILGLCRKIKKFILTKLPTINLEYKERLSNFLES